MHVLMNKRALQGPPAVGTPHAKLGVDLGASAEDIRRAYRRLAARWHPDKWGPSFSVAERERAAAEFLEIQRAYETLHTEGFSA